MRQLEGQEVKFFQFGDDCGLFSGDSMVGKLEIENRQVKVPKDEGSKKRRKATKDEISKLEPGQERSFRLVEKF